MYFKGIFLLGLLWSNALLAAEMGPCDSWFTPSVNPRAVVVVSHGMNLRPERMDEMAQVLSSAGYEVLRPAFTGHCGNNEEYLQVKAGQWEGDARRIYQLAHARAQTLQVPIYLVAYSFTALVFQAMEEELPFARKVYFAPALATKFWYPALRLVARIFPDFQYQSRNLDGYAANARSNARSFLALDEWMQRWKGKKEAERSSTPVLIFAEPDDELVSLRGLKNLASQRSSWELEEISNQGNTLGKTYHHLVIDQAALGGAEWVRVTRKMLEFLK